MTDPNTHINYTIQDIERYLNGGMSAKEMHDMERAALQDPFLADAIEGYSEASMQQSNQHLNEITALLQRDKQDAKVVIMPSKSFQWWRVAAMIILLAGVGLFSWYLIGTNKPANNKQEVAAAKENNLPLTKDTNTAIAKADTTAYIAQNKTAETKLSLHKKETQVVRDEEVTLSKQKEETAANNRSDKESNTEDQIIAGKPDSLSYVEAFAPGLEKNKADSDKRILTPLQGRGAGLMNNNIAFNQFSGVVLDNNNQPVPNAVVNARNQHAAFTDKNGYFKIIAPDSTLKVSVSSVGYETANVSLSQGFANKISIEPDQQSLSEVVISGYGSKKRVQVKAEHADSAFPAGGWESFQQYVYRKMNKPFDSTNNDIITMHGAVEIEFSIGNDGDPYNFNVVRSSGKENDEKVINAIKEGPRWITTKKNKKGKVIIQF